MMARQSGWQRWQRLECKSKKTWANSVHIGWLLLAAGSWPPAVCQTASVVARRKGRKEIAPGGQRSVVRAFLPGCHGPHAFQPFLSTPVAGRRQQRVVPAAPDFFPRRRRVWETERVETRRTVVCIVDILVHCPLPPTGSGVATKVR